MISNQNVTKLRSDYHDFANCYCHDMIAHLKKNEKRFTYREIPMITITDSEDFSNEECLRAKRCKFNTFRQRTTEWMIWLQEYFTNCEETLEMATRLFDHFFYNEFYSKIQVTENKNGKEVSLDKKTYHDQECIHLIAVACYFLSCKFWERFPPKISKLIHLTEYAYTEIELLAMEREILMKIDFDLKIPLISQYIEFYMMHEKEFYISKVKIVSYYLTNLALTEMVFTNRLASSISAVILTLSKMILNLFTVNESSDFQLYTYDTKLFDTEDFYEILKDMWQIFINSVANCNSYKIQKKKFSEQKYQYLYLYLKSIDLQKLQICFQDLTYQVKNDLALKKQLNQKNF